MTTINLGQAWAFDIASRMVSENMDLFEEIVESVEMMFEDPTYDDVSDEIYDEVSVINRNVSYFKNELNALDRKYFKEFGGKSKVFKEDYEYVWNSVGFCIMEYWDEGKLGLTNV